MVSEALDNPELSQTGLFNSFWIYWTLHLLSCFMDLHIISMDKDCLDSYKEHSETQTPENLSDLPSELQILQW